MRCRCLDVSDTQKGGHSERSQPDLLSVRTRAATLSCDQWPQYATQTMLGRLETFPGLLRARVRRATLGLFSLYTRRSRGPANGALTRKPPFEGRKRGVLSVMVETAFDCVPQDRTEFLQVLSLLLSPLPPAKEVSAHISHSDAVARFKNVQT